MLQIFTGLPLGLSTQIDPADTFTGNGVQTTFTLSNKTGARLGRTIQFDLQQFNIINGGYSKSGNNFTLISAPPNGSQGYAPGTSTLNFVAYDQASVPGVVNPNVSIVPFIVGDVTEIQNYSYQAYPGLPNVQIAFVDLVSALGFESAWTQIASSGNFSAMGTFNPLQTPLYTADISAFGLSASGFNPGVNVFVPCSNASSFIVNDYVMINPGFSTAEVCRIQSVQSNGFTVDGVNFNHFTTEAIYTCGRLFYAKITVPINQFSGQAQSLYESGLRIQTTKISRL